MGLYKEGCINLLLGEYKHSCDSKNRLRIPPKFKKEFTEGMVLTKGNDGCLFVVPKKQFDVILEKVSSLPIFDSTVQRPIRMLFSSAVEIEEDNQGRFLLPQSLKAFAGIEKEVVFVGVGSRVELWSLEKWNEYCTQSNSNFDQVLNSLGEHGI